MLDVILIVVAIIAIILIWIMLYDSNRFVVVKHTIRDKRIKESLRVVVLADLHNKQYGKGNAVLLEAIEAQNPQAVLVAGDILTAHPKKSLKPAISFMEKLAEKYPIFYGNGNHEHRIKLYPETYGDMAQEYGDALRKMNVEPLVNAHKDIKEKNITIYGAEINRKYYKRFTVPYMEETYLKSILGEPDEKSYNILLAHNPDYFPQYASWGADLVLSGHVHGGIVRIPGWKGVASPNIRFFPKYDGGIFTEGKSTMILSRGLGMHTIPVRLFNPGELIVIDFEGE